MRYYVRTRGEKSILGPYSIEELESQLKAGKLTSTVVVLPDSGKTPEQLQNPWKDRWVAISSLPGLERYVPEILLAERKVESSSTAHPYFAYSVVALPCLILGFVLVYIYFKGVDTSTDPAVLECESPISIVSIDGELKFAQKVKLQPGRHEAELSYSGRSHLDLNSTERSGRLRVTFDVRAGRNYRVNWKLSKHGYNQTWSADIVED